MNRRDQKRERHNRRRKERQKELRLHREEAALRPQITETAPADLRHMSARDWDDFETLTFEAVIERAREMYPRHGPLKHWVRGKSDGLPMRDADSQEVALLLTLAARTVRSDPPWHWPRVTWKREPDVVFHLSWKSKRLVRNAEHGTVGFWGLELPRPDGPSVEVGFTHHAIERLLQRLAIDDPVRLRLFAEFWMLFLMADTETATVAFPRSLTLREGDLVLPLSMRVHDREEALGFFPVVFTEAGAVAKTFLEPWMSGSAPAVRYTADERKGFQARFVEEVLPWAYRMFNAGSYVLAGKSYYGRYEERLLEAYGDRPSRERVWLDRMVEGSALFDQGRYREAGRAIEQGFALIDEVTALAHPLFLMHFEGTEVRILLSTVRYLLAQIYSRASTGQDLGPGEAPPTEAESARLVAKGKELMARVAAEAPDVLGKNPRGDADIARVM